MKRVELAGLALEAIVGAPIVLLREQDERHRLLSIDENIDDLRAFLGDIDPSQFEQDDGPGS